MIALKQQYTWAMAAPTSIGARLTPATRQPVHTSQTFLLTSTSAETNVLNIPASLGLPVKVLTNFVSESPIAHFLKSDLAARGIAYEGPEIPQENPWGHRHQLNIADSGFGVRGPQVYNDRAGEVGRQLSADDFDMERLFAQEGVAILHISGLIAALSPQTGALCLQMAQAAKRNGTVVSFDLNYRASFWEDREMELRAIFTEIAAHADFLLGNEEDFQLCLGLQGPKAGGDNLADKIDSFKTMIRGAQAAYPQAKVFATTLREVLSANTHLWGAVMLAGEEWHVILPREIQVLDRIGGGDSFMGGLLYGVLQGWEPERWLQFGWATGALATTMLTDYATPFNEAQVWNIFAGNARVQR